VECLLSARADVNAKNEKEGKAKKEGEKEGKSDGEEKQGDVQDEKGEPTDKEGKERIAQGISTNIIPNIQRLFNISNLKNSFRRKEEITRLLQTYPEDELQSALNLPNLKKPQIINEVTNELTKIF
jgi:hypothetical protein